MIGAKFTYAYLGIIAAGAIILAFVCILALVQYMRKKMTRARILRMVMSNLDSAMSQGLFDEGEYLHGLNAEDLAIEMMAFAEDIIVEDIKAPKLVPYIEHWMSTREAIR